MNGLNKVDQNNARGGGLISPLTLGVSMDLNLVPQETIQSKILFLRGKRVMLDKDIAMLYGVPTGRLNEQVKRNIKRFPEEFMFQLSKEEFDNLISQFAISKRGGTRKPSFAFTELGIAMLSSVLNSEKAIQINIQIIKVFIKMREMLINYQEVRQKIEEMEQKYDYQFKIVFEAIRQLLEPPDKPEKKIGFQND